MRLRRRITELEERIATLEAATGIDYTMPTRPDIDMDPRGPLIAWEPAVPNTALDDDEEGWQQRLGVYL